MNSVADASSPGAERWHTSDGAPWWIREGSFGYPAGDYEANCYLNIDVNPTDPDDVSFKDEACNFEASSYYCQKERFPTTPKDGSPSACSCKRIELTGIYSAGMLVKCERCIDVSKTQEKNSCPHGTKIFSPRSREDWKTFLASAEPLRTPSWIIDITRDDVGCGGCTFEPEYDGQLYDHAYDMNSEAANQATWKTSDGSPWWLRSTQYTQPNGKSESQQEANGVSELARVHEYKANCYMDLWQNPTSEDAITFDDDECHAHSRSYYCQTVSTTTTTTDGESVQAVASSSSSSSGGGCSGSQCSISGYSLFTDTGRCSGWYRPPDGNQGYQGRYEDCFQHCSEDPECEFISTYDDGKTCVHSKTGGCDSFFTSCSGGCRAFKKGEAIQGFALQDVSTHCDPDKMIGSRSECLEAAATLGSDAHVYEQEVDVPTNPQGCFINTGSNRLYFNTASGGAATTFIRPLCKSGGSQEGYYYGVVSWPENAWGAWNEGSYGEQTRCLHKDDTTTGSSGITFTQCCSGSAGSAASYGGGQSRTCSEKEKTYEEAVAFCEGKDQRLCTKDEMLAHAGASKGCLVDGQGSDGKNGDENTWNFAWTSDPC